MMANRLRSQTNVDNYNLDLYSLMMISFFFFFFFFFFLNGTGTFINIKPEGNYNSPKANIQPESYKHACRSKVVNRDTESLTTKLGTNLA
jgi:hypothetical protein